MSETLPNNTLENKPKEVKPYKLGVFDAWITFKALGGMITDDNGKVTMMTQDQFCEAYEVAKSTTNLWRKGTPNLGQLIRERREEIVPLGRETAAWNQLYLLGMQTQDKRAAVDALKTYLGHYSELRLPTQAVKHEVGQSITDLISSHRQTQNENRVIIDAEAT
jgi:hypothetical protein